MADVSREQISEIGQRVTATVAKEMHSGASAYSVDDLRASVTDLGKIGDTVAWEITYKTSKAGLVELGDEVRSSDVAVVLYTSDSHEPAAWISAGLELRGIEVRRLWMAPLVDAGFSAR